MHGGNMARKVHTSRECGMGMGGAEGLRLTAMRGRCRRSSCSPPHHTACMQPWHLPGDEQACHNLTSKI